MSELGREGAGPLTALGAVDGAPVPPALVLEHVERRGRLSVAFRLLLILPQAVVLYFLWLVGLFALVAGWFTALVLGRLPEPIARYLCHLTRYTTRVYAYGWLLTDRYPPFRFSAEDYPVRVELAPGRLNRLAVLFRLFLAIPAAILSGLAVAGWTLAAFFIWVLVLVAGRVPGPLFDATTAVLRYSMRLNAYTGLVTAAYPWGLFGDRPAPPGPPEPAAGPGPAGGPEEAIPGAAALAERLEPPRAPRGLLVLSTGARGLVILFVVLGVAQWVADGAVGAITGSNAPTSTEALSAVTCPTQTTSATTGATQPNGLEKKSPDQVAQAAAAALRAAKSVHITWTSRSEGKAMRVEVCIQGGSYAGAIEQEGGRFEVIGIGNDTYFRADEGGYKLAGVPRLLGRLAAGQWTKFSSKEMSFEEQFSLNSFADMLTTGSTFYPAVDQATLDGDKVVVVSEGEGFTLYVANNGPAYPRRADSEEADLGRIDFTEYGVDFHITTPS